MGDKNLTLEALKNMGKLSPAFLKVAEQIEHMSEPEFQKYTQDLLADVPHICDFCDYFSGNLGIIRNSELGMCLNRESSHFKQAINEHKTCDKWKN